MSTEIVTTSSIAPSTPDFKSRQEQARLACEAAGIVWPGTILPEGTALYSSGVETLKNDRAAWKRLPIASEVIGLVEAALHAEQRQDFEVKVEDLRLRPADGRIVKVENLENPHAVGLGYGQHTMRQLVQQISTVDDAPKGFASALIYLTDTERAEILNPRLAKMSTLAQQGELVKPDEDHTTAITLRTRLPHTGDRQLARIARAALSGRYGSVVDTDIAKAIGSALVGDTSGRLDYKPGDSQSRFEVIWPSEIPVETFVVGDVHYACLSISNSETGEGSLRIVPAVIRARCANLTLSVGEGINETIRHIGDPATLLLRLQKAIRRALDDMEPLLMSISQAARIPLGAFSAEKAIAAIAKKYELTKASVPLVLEAHKASAYPDTIWGISSAISEAAHKQATWTDEASWEKVASDFQAKAVEVVRKGTPAAMALEKALALN